MMKVLQMSVVLAALSLMTLAGSGCDVGTTTQDGGINDTGPLPDGGQKPDGGNKPDGGIADGGQPVDGSTVDGGVPQDGGGYDGNQPTDANTDDGGVQPDGSAEDGGEVTDGSVTDGGAGDGGSTDGSVADSGAADGGWLSPDASYLNDGGLCGDLNQQCCAGGKCIWGYNCIGGTCRGQSADGGAADGGAVTDGGAQDGGYNPDGGQCGYLFTPCCYGYLCFEGTCNAMYCIPVSDGGSPDVGPQPDGGGSDGGLNPDATYYNDGGTCGNLHNQCCANSQCVWGLTCQGGKCEMPVTDGGSSDGGVKPDGGGSDGGMSDGGTNPDAGTCGYLYTPCCYGYLCYQGYCNDIYCAPYPDGGSTDGGGSDGGLNPDATYYNDGGTCGNLHNQCCANSQCVWGLTCQGGKCEAPITDGGVVDGGYKPDGGGSDGGVNPDGGGGSDGGATDGGSCGALYQECCPGYQCNKGVCNGVYCAPPQDGGLDGGGTCGALGQPCCAAFQCYSPLLCDGYVCFQLDGGVSDGGVSDGGPRPDGGGTDGAVSDGGMTDGGPKPDGGSTDGGCTPNCTDKCGGAPNGCGGTCTDACPEGNNCSGQACVPCGAAKQPCCDNGAACKAVEPTLYCYEATCEPLPICSVSPTFMGGDMCLVPMGPFSMGCSNNDKDCAQDEVPLHDPVLSEYWIDKYEVTVAEYFMCVEIGACEAPKTNGETCNWGVTGREKHPMNCIDWAHSQAYCNWALKSLPTEAQWEKAARGLNVWIYPWGDEPLPTCKMASMSDPDVGGPGCGTGISMPVGSFEVESPFGEFDTAGNVWEWVYDWYDAAYYESSPATDPVGPDKGTYRVIRGGAWDSMGNVNLRTSKRGNADPYLMLDNVGFRCSFMKKK